LTRRSRSERHSIVDFGKWVTKHPNGVSPVMTLNNMWLNAKDDEVIQVEFADGRRQLFALANVQGCVDHGRPSHRGPIASKEIKRWRKITIT